MCGLEAAQFYLHPGIIHDVVLLNLKPNSDVFYQVVNSKEKSSVFQFRSAPLVGAQHAITIFAFGDSGTSYCQGMLGWCEPPSEHTYANIEADMKANPSYSLLIQYAEINFRTSTKQVRLTAPGKPSVATATSRMPLGMQIDGNSTSTRSLRLLRASRTWYRSAITSMTTWRNPSVPSGATTEMTARENADILTGTISTCLVNKHRGIRTRRHCFRLHWRQLIPLLRRFNYGNVHFTFMSTEHDMNPGSVQYKWLDHDLRTVDRSKTPFVVFSGHRPLYTTETADRPANGTWYVNALRGLVEPLLSKYRVDLALWAHVHAYERTCPVYDHKCTEGATTHVVIGMGGMELTTELKVPPPAWLVFRDAEYGYTRITTTEDSLTMQFVANIGKVVKDEFTLQRQHF